MVKISTPNSIFKSESVQNIHANRFSIELRKHILILITLTLIEILLIYKLHQKSVMKKKFPGIETTFASLNGGHRRRRRSPRREIRRFGRKIDRRRREIRRSALEKGRPKFAHK